MFFKNIKKSIFSILVNADNVVISGTNDVVSVTDLSGNGNNLEAVINGAVTGLPKLEVFNGRNAIKINDRNYLQKLDAINGLTSLYENKNFSLIAVLYDKKLTISGVVLLPAVNLAKL